LRKGAPARNVDAYIGAAPKQARAKLVQLRNIIRAAAPKADESISYQIPAYTLNGKPLVYFAAFTNHVSLFAISVKEHQHELKGYETSKGTVRFPLDRPLPVALIKKLVKARIKNTEAGRKK
jgi:uncharacterized protein YdhG (YjbR/CyaY superfamily)